MILGAYTVPSWVNRSQGDRLTQRRCDLRTVAAAGLNLLHCGYLEDAGAARSLLDLAGDLGVSIIFEGVLGRDLALVANHPALLAVNVSDDANLKKPADVQTACNLAGSVPRYLSMFPAWNDPRPALYGPAEIVGAQSYVFGGTETLGSAYVVWKAAREQADRAGVRVFANSQLHSIGGPLPTAEQVRAQTWLAAVCGLDGVLAYTLAQGETRVDPAIWAAYTAACAEVRSFASGRPVINLAPDGVRLVARWPGGIELVLDLAKSRVVKLQRRTP